MLCAYVLLCALSLHVDATPQTNIVQDEALAAKDVELKQASAALMSKVCLFYRV